MLIVTINATRGKPAEGKCERVITTLWLLPYYFGVYMLMHVNSVCGMSHFGHTKDKSVVKTSQ